MLSLARGRRGANFLFIQGMFDRDKSGNITFDEFGALWKYVTDWQETFRSFDRDRSGRIDKGELQTGTPPKKDPAAAFLSYLSMQRSLPLVLMDSIWVKFARVNAV